jgi:hypothetical protein
MYTAKIVSVEKGHLQEDNSDFLDVRFELSDGKTKLVKKEGFPLDTSEEVIQKTVQAHLDLLKEEKLQAKKNEKAEALQAKADETISSLVGKKFKTK